MIGVSVLCVFADLGKLWLCPPSLSLSLSLPLRWAWHLQVQLQWQ